jgi:hypothetical protein
MSRTLNKLALVAAGLGLATACSPTGTQGELGHGVFAYACVDDSDIGCDEVTLPTAVAVGARFGLSYDAEVTEKSDTDHRHELVAKLSSASERMLQTTPEQQFVPLQAGQLAILARLDDGRVADLVHVNAVQPLLGFFDGEQPLSDITLSEGDTNQISARALHPTNGDRLAGSLACAWSVDDNSIVDLVQMSRPCRVELQANASGVVILTMDTGHHRTEMLVHVEKN